LGQVGVYGGSIKWFGPRERTDERSVRPVNTSDIPDGRSKHVTSLIHRSTRSLARALRRAVRVRWGQAECSSDPHGKTEARIVSALDLGDSALAAAGGEGNLFLAHLELLAPLAYHLAEAICGLGVAASPGTLGLPRTHYHLFIDTSAANGSLSRNARPTNMGARR